MAVLAFMLDFRLVITVLHFKTVQVQRYCNKCLAKLFFFFENEARERQLQQQSFHSFLKIKWDFVMSLFAAG